MKNIFSREKISNILEPEIGYRVVFVKHKTGDLRSLVNTTYWLKNDEKAIDEPDKIRLDIYTRDNENIIFDVSFYIGDSSTSVGQYYIKVKYLPNTDTLFAEDFSLFRKYKHSDSIHKLELAILQTLCRKHILKEVFCDE